MTSTPLPPGLARWAPRVLPLLGLALGVWLVGRAASEVDVAALGAALVATQLAPQMQAQAAE